MEQVNLFLESLRSFWLELSSFLPQLFGAIVLFIVGWLLAKLVQRIVRKGLLLIRFDVLAEKSGIEGFLLQGGVRFTTVTLVSNIVYWFILLTVILAALNTLGLQAAAELFNQIILYIPNVLVAIIVLIFGALFAKFVRSATFTYLSNVGIDGAEVISTVAQYAILVFTVSIALEQLAIGGEILVSAFQIAFGALCLALAIAFGLGGKEWASRILENLSKKAR